MQHWMLENDKYYIVGQDIDVIIILIIIIDIHSISDHHRLDSISEGINCVRFPTKLRTMP